MRALLAVLSSGLGSRRSKVEGERGGGKYVKSVSIHK